jgi:valyl-tRNA synthetase
MRIDKEYRPDQSERRWSEKWAEAGIFSARPDSGKTPFCMVIPPPNVTGNLHIGHVLVYTLHDIAARWRRMQGHDVLWLPGTDHAGIATQMVVERELSKQKIDRRDLGREEFEKKVWEWKETYGGRIIRSLRELGSSVDWTRERFTLDEGLSRAVRAVFVRLYREGLIYRDRYIVNWCPRCQTAISDLEAVGLPVSGKLWRIRYPTEDGAEALEVATTRPETLLGDTGLAVNPKDERYRGWVGRSVRVPLTDRLVPVVSDDFVDPEFGTGAVKVTPAHDPNDFEAGRRHGFAEIVVIDNAGRMTEAAGAYAGLDRFRARKRVVADLQQQGLLVDVQPHEHAVGHCQRCNTMIEPLVSTQWFVKIKPLADAAIAAVEQGRTRFVPEAWAKTYFEWMRNIHDWCISRQLWWGHRIPAWYCDPCGEVVVSEEDPTRCNGCGAPLRRDEDVLDTWFSSALWPFSTLGWPDETEDLARYYPTTLLITGHDIIFFWVARMLMLGLKFMGDVPFREVYIHGLVRDAQGRKMSKSKGNTVDPEEVHGQYGTDAVRFTMAILAAPGNDIPLAPERMEGYRAFANKLWNATRFVLMRIGDEEVPRFGDEDLSLADRWMLSRTQRAIGEVTRCLDEYRFDRAADALYHFVWGQFCDWYIELVKPDLPPAGETATDATRSATARGVLVEVLGTLLRLLHPFMPFVTEELWHKLPGRDDYLALADWPRMDEARIDAAVERDVELLQDLTVKIRNLRAETNIDPGKRIRVLLHPGADADRRLLRREGALVASLVRAEAIDTVERLDETMIAARAMVRGVQIAIPLEGLLDFTAERDRLQRDLEKVERELQSRTRKLSNQSFLERAPEEIVEREHRLRADLVERHERLKRNLDLLAGK